MKDFTRIDDASVDIFAMLIRAVGEHQRMDSHDLNRRRVRAYADGLHDALKALNDARGRETPSVEILAEVLTASQETKGE